MFSKKNSIFSKYVHFTKKPQNLLKIAVKFFYAGSPPKWEPYVETIHMEKKLVLKGVSSVCLNFFVMVGIRNSSESEG